MKRVVGKAVFLVRSMLRRPFASRRVPYAPLALAGFFLWLLLWLATWEDKEPKYLQFEVCNGYANQRISIVMGLLIGEALVRSHVSVALHLRRSSEPDRDPSQPLHVRAAERLGRVRCRRRGALCAVQRRL